MNEEHLVFSETQQHLNKDIPQKYNFLIEHYSCFLLIVVLTSSEAFQITHIMKKLLVEAVKLYDNFNHRFAKSM